MEHNRHRAPGRSSRRSLALACVAGLVVGALAVGAGWWISEGSGLPPASTAKAATPAASAPTDTTRKPAESRNQVAIPSAAAAPPSTSSDPVLLLGDSLAVGIGPYVDAGLGERLLTLDAAEGRGTATSESLLESYAASSAPIWIVSLGTNDNPDEFEDPARSIVDMAGPDRCVVWFDVWREDTDDSINTSLNEIAGSHPNMHLIPWHEVAAMHSDWFTGTDVHPSSAGYAVRGQMAVDAVHGLCD